MPKSQRRPTFVAHLVPKAFRHALLARASTAFAQQHEKLSKLASEVRPKVCLLSPAPVRIPARALHDSATVAAFLSHRRPTDRPSRAHGSAVVPAQAQGVDLGLCRRPEVEFILQNHPHTPAG